MLEFNVSGKEAVVISKGFTSFKVYHDGVKWFIKVGNREQSPMEEVLVSTLLGYIDNLPEEGYMDYQLCWVNSTAAGSYGRHVGVCCEYIDGSFIPIYTLFSKHEDAFGNWEKYGQTSFSGFMKDFGCLDYKEAKPFLKVMSDVIVKETAFTYDERRVSDYFIKMGMVDNIIHNAKNLYDYKIMSAGRQLLPLHDFSDCLGYRSKRGFFSVWSRDFYKLLKDRYTKDDLLKIHFDQFVSDWCTFKDEEYGLNDVFQEEFKLLVKCLEDTENIFWVRV